MSTSRAGGPEPDASPARRTGTDDAGVESNARLTAMTAAVLLVLLAVEGVTVLRVHSLLWLHVFLGTASPIVLETVRVNRGPGKRDCSESLKPSSSS